jgi:hypothetical protein
MSRVTIEKGKLRIGRERIDLLSGEFHYWRTQPRYWRKSLEALAEMGVPIVATYVAWEHHELEPGRFDFTGETDPSRDLEGFLHLAASLGLKVLLRPGPYIYSEWRNLGVPDRAAAMSRMSEEFRTEALPYLRAIVEFAKPYLATNGGPVVLWQADNEIDVMPWAYERELGTGNDAGLFQEWLAGRYGKISILNEVWGTTFEEFAEARPIQRNLIDDVDYRRRHLDWIHFRQEVNTQNARWMVSAYQTLGIDVPMLLNSYPVQDSLNWRQLAESAELFGIDSYPADGFGANREEHRIFVEKCLVQSTLPTTPYIAECESGVWHGQHEYTGVPSPGHYRLMCLSALAAGIQGWNWYMSVERDNWLFSPINNRGEKRVPLFEEFQGLTALFEEMSPSRLKRIVGTAVFHDSTQAAFKGAYGEDPARMSLYEAGIPYSLWDPAGVQAKQKPLLYYSGPSWLDRVGHARLLAFVKDGGRLVLPGRWPRFDESFEPHDRLGIPLPDLCFDSEDLVIEHKDGDLPVRGPVFAYGAKRPPGKPILARIRPKDVDDDIAIHRGRLRGETYCVGFEQKLGKGRIMMLGFTPTPEATLWIHRRCRTAIAARALTSRTQACLLKGARGVAWLIVLNLSDQEQTTRVQLGGKTPWQAKAARITSRDGVQELALSIPAKDGAAILLEASRSSR